MATIGLVEGFVEGGGLREILEAVTVLAGFGLIGFWLQRNRIALELEQGRRQT
jgi:hydrogenase/urease accessory protein HupE